MLSRITGGYSLARLPAQPRSLPPGGSVSSHTKKGIRPGSGPQQPPAVPARWQFHHLLVALCLAALRAAAPARATLRAAAAVALVAFLLQKSLQTLPFMRSAMNYVVPANQQARCSVHLCEDRRCC